MNSLRRLQLCIIITTDLPAAQTQHQESEDGLTAFNNIFFAKQVLCNLLELNITKNSWVVLGPRARAGLGRIKTLELDFVEFVGKKLSMKHIEHGLCEHGKYFRLAAEV